MAPSSPCLRLGREFSNVLFHCKVRLPHCFLVGSGQVAWHILSPRQLNGFSHGRLVRLLVGKWSHGREQAGRKDMAWEQGHTGRKALDDGHVYKP